MACDPLRVVRLALANLDAMRSTATGGMVGGARRRRTYADGDEERARTLYDELG